MIVRYNSLDRFEVPKFTLCNPGSVYAKGIPSRQVGILSDTEAEEIVFNFNATSELSMRVNRIVRDDMEENAYTHRIYKALQNRRLIFVDDIGYFIITDVKDNHEGFEAYKDVKAKSVDAELQQKMIPYIENGTYRFISDETETQKGILEMIVETLPLWMIGEVDEVVANRWRTFEDVDTSLNCLSFLMTNVQDAYECIIVFDCINRVINVYDQANYVRQTDIHITQEDFINSLEVSENADDLFTAISVFGDGDVTVAAINPLGTNVLYDFSHYSSWMSEGLGEKVLNWQNEVANSREDYYKSNLAYFQTLDNVNNYQLELDAIAQQITMYTRCRNNIVAESSTSLVAQYNAEIAKSGGEAITIFSDIQDTLDCIDDLIAKCESKMDNTQIFLNQANAYLAMHKSDVDAIRNRLDMSTYFTEDEYAELCLYVYEGKYTDDYVTFTESMTYEQKFEQMKILYDRAVGRLDKVSQPTQEFSLDVENFIFIKEFEQWSDQLETGCLINVEVDKDDIAMLFLSNITINYDDHNLSMTFGNRFNKFDPKSLFDDVLGNISKTANTLGYIKDVLYPIKSGEFDYMKEALQTSRDLTMGAALSSQGEEVVIDGSGYTGRKLRDNGTYDPQQVKLTGRSLVFTDDAWETCKTAIGEILLGDGTSTYGVNAQAIIGEILLGHNLHILDSEGRPLLEVVDGKITSSVGPINDRMTVIEQNNSKIDIRIQSLENEGVDAVTTKAGYTFDEYGLTIYKEGTEIKNLLDNSGMYVTRSGEEILTANSDGVRAINMTATQYLIVGVNSRFESYSNGEDGKRTGCFYIGG